MIDFMSIIAIGLQVIGGATLLFRLLEPIAAQTANKWDDSLVNKTLAILTIISRAVSLNKESSEVKIKLNR